MGNNKVLIFGASGQLGQCLKQVKNNIDGWDFLFLPESEADVLNREQLEGLFQKYNPVAAINCAAYTAVDKAEDDVEKAEAINAVAPGILAELSTAHDTTLVHVSTDFVFGGVKPVPLLETDVAEPIGVYGETKLRGERLIQEKTAKYFILRTSWLYSEYGNNFVKTMLRLGAERDSLNVVADQVGTPTYAMDLANAIVQIVQSGSDAYGIYHYSNEGVASWYDFAKAIFELAGINITVNPVPTEAYPTRAKRPAYSVMDKRKIKATFGLDVSYWRDSLRRCLAKL